MNPVRIATPGPSADFNSLNKRLCSASRIPCAERFGFLVLWSCSECMHRRSNTPGTPREGEVLYYGEVDGTLTPKQQCNQLYQIPNGLEVTGPPPTELSLASSRNKKPPLASSRSPPKPRGLRYGAHAALSQSSPADDLQERIAIYSREGEPPRGRWILSSAAPVRCLRRRLGALDMRLCRPHAVRNRDRRRQQRTLGKRRSCSRARVITRTDRGSYRARNRRSRSRLSKTKRLALTGR